MGDEGGAGVKNDDGGGAAVDGAVLGQGDASLGADGASPDATTTVGVGDSSVALASGASVLQRHKNATRDGLYIDPLMTHAAVRGIHLDAAFNPPAIQGPVYAQPLYAENGAMGRETIYIATEQDIVYALDANTGALIWQKQVGTPIPQSAFDCANIDPVGITGTPVIDLNSRTVFLNAMNSPDGGTTKQHVLYALSLDDGSIRHNYPVDLGAKLAAQNVTFDPAYEQQRGGLALMQNRLYIPYGGYAGDCGVYHGFVLGVPIENANQVYYWSTPGNGGGIWGVGGPASDGQALYVATGNTDTTIASWGAGDSLVKLGPGPTFSTTTSDYFTPSNWRDLDQGDLELGGTQPIVIDMPGAAHPKIAVALAKNGNMYIADRTNLGGLGTGNGTTGEGLASAHFTSDYIINAAAAFTSASGTYVVFKGAGVNCPTGSTLLAVKIGAADPPTLTQAWCAAPDGAGSPIVSTTDGHSEPIVWMLGAEGNTRVMALDGETGSVVFDGGVDTYPAIARFQSPIIVKGRVIWASTQQVIAFTVK